MLNKIILTGRLTADVEMKQTKTDKSMAKFSIACKRTFGEETDFFNCTTFLKTAENMAKFFKKGDLVTIIGRVQQEKWEKDGVKHSSYSIVVTDFEFPGTGKVDMVKDASPVEVVKDTFQGEEVNAKPFNDEDIPF